MEGLLEIICPDAARTENLRGVFYGGNTGVKLLYHGCLRICTGLMVVRGEAVAKVLDRTAEKRIGYPESVPDAIRNRDNLIAMHTHPHSMPPSIPDFNSCLEHNYAVCLVICHDGTIYNYVSSQEVPAGLQDIYIGIPKNRT